MPQAQSDDKLFQYAVRLVFFQASYSALCLHAEQIPLNTVFISGL